MNAREAIFLIVALGVSLGIVVFVFQPDTFVAPAPEMPTISLQAPAQVNVAESFTLSVDARGVLGKTLILNDGETSRSYACESDPCVFSFPWSFSSPGKKVIVVGTGIRDRVHIDVESVSSITYCVDGTAEGKCSSTPPLHCTGMKLMADCELCGCSNGEMCQNNACVPPAYAFSIPALAWDVPAYANASAFVNASIRNDASFPVSGLFVIFIDAYDSSGVRIAQTPQQIQIDALASHAIKNSVIAVTFASSTAKVGARFFLVSGGTYPDADAIGETASLYPISLVSDTLAPLPPTNVSISEGDDEKFLSWNASASPDVKMYVIYQQNFANGGFTTYSILAETPILSYAIGNPAEKTAYVVRSKDGAGNLSDPSDPVVT